MSCTQPRLPSRDQKADDRLVGPIIDEYYAASEAVGASFITAEDWLAHPVRWVTIGRYPARSRRERRRAAARRDRRNLLRGRLRLRLPRRRGQDSGVAGRARLGTVGDIGYLDENGYLHLTDRRHHMIISGGVNIYPQEAENLLITHPKVLDAAVFGIPDEQMGQSVKGVVQTVDPADATDEFAAELLAWVRKRLAPYKCPRSISFERQLPAPTPASSTSRNW
ncbi:AMP-binding enzyme family protein [Mycobacterium xenopi 4042]|uniref:AMP-binding enzyme family protein n=1 Tax=Mycobacterium xenopi 4042 TaxID=1299334 RepID=X8DEM0_MYCXE|nr:AMP-binding enzyme family protein [Mycobacterium xenopi 4042]